MRRIVARLSLVAATTLAFALGASVDAAQAGKKKLKPGDLAPNLDGITDWVQGEAPKLSDGVHVVEFWATWCAPCKRAIPHLNKMYKKWGGADFTITGVAADEKGTSYDENTSGVKSFVRGRGEGMAYPVAVDNLGEAKRKWMEAAGREGIPCTFVVGRSGRILWIGNPHDERFEEIVKLALRNKYDPQLTPKGFEALDAAKRAAGVRNWREAYQQLDKAIEVDPPLFGWLIVDRYKMTLEQEKNPAAAKQYLKTIMPAVAADPYSLEMVIHAICRDPEIGDRDLASAMSYAEQMKKAVGSTPAPGLAMLAMVHATKGELDKAVELQTNAWLAAPVDVKEEMKRQLDEYQKIKARKEQAKALVDN